MAGAHNDALALGLFLLGLLVLVRLPRQASRAVGGGAAGRPWR
ncbi:hypothetical protein [Micromonospora sp. C28ISP2-4]|nr:hypothetical protein [Micromonospora sp. C28ISP2-4]MDO3686906.1 hypothetical protein [Micromonospora sp. C28ISP2-4]